MKRRSAKKDFWKNQEHQFLFLTLILAIAVGIPAGRSVVMEPEFPQPVSEESSRSPAAVAVATVEDRNLSWNKAKNVTVELDCKNLKINSEVDASHLRLMSSNCGWSDVVIKNSRNGYTASVVNLGLNKFTTDFIELADGENLLEVSGKDSQGKTVAKEFRVQRRMPASEVSN